MLKRYDDDRSSDVFFGGLPAYNYHSWDNLTIDGYLVDAFLLGHIPKRKRDPRWCLNSPHDAPERCVALPNDLPMGK